MKPSRIIASLALGILFPSLAHAQTKPEPLPIPGHSAGLDVPNAHELPDPTLTYKIIFEVNKGAGKPTDVNPALDDIAGFVNALAKYGVPPSHRKLVVIVYASATSAIENNETYKAHNGGHDNPNIDLIRALTKAGVSIQVCGQSVLYHKLDAKMIQPEVQIDFAAWVTLANYETRGYTHLMLNE
jgi:intracellular sulfur oxidation DsrE/DsrF family protein